MYFFAIPLIWSVFNHRKSIPMHLIPKQGGKEEIALLDLTNWGGNYRIPERVRLGGTPVGHLVRPFCSGSLILKHVEQDP